MPMNPRTLTDSAGRADAADRPTAERIAPTTGRPFVILGSCRDDAFVADQVLVEAGTLEAETAIRRWLREHDIRLAASLRSALSTDGRGPR